MGKTFYESNKSLDVILNTCTALEERASKEGNLTHNMGERIVWLELFLTYMLHPHEFPQKTLSIKHRRYVEIRKSENTARALKKSNAIALGSIAKLTEQLQIP